MLKSRFLRLISSIVGAFILFVLFVLLVKPAGTGPQKAHAATTPPNTPPSNLFLSLDSAVIDEGGSMLLSGTFEDTDTQDTHSVAINWGDGGSTTISLSIGESAFSASHQYLDNNLPGTPSGNFSIGATVTDSASQSTSASAEITVNNVAPLVGVIAAPATPLSINDPLISVSATFTDPGVLDTYTALWGWGDGVSTDGDVTFSDGSGIIDGSHTYAEPGVYEVTLAVTDDDNGSGQSIFQFVVVYDPSGGFVTGGGWINSPAGAYTADPLLSGRANFGFVSKYKKGSQAPSGNTEFQFKAGDLNFNSDNYDWLLIAGAKAIYKGTGVINGNGNYGFMLSAIDGDLKSDDDFDVDLFRIKIWDKDNNDGVVYDNQMCDHLDDNMCDLDDNADPISAIGGGSIVIHKGGKK